MVRIPSMNVRSFVVLFSASGIGFHRSWLGVSTNLERSPWPKLLKEVDEVEEKEIEMDKKIDSMMSAMAAIQIKLDMDPTIDVDPKVDNDKSKKPKAKKPKAGKDEVSEKDLFNRKPSD